MSTRYWFTGSPGLGQSVKFPLTESYSYLYFTPLLPVDVTRYEILLETPDLLPTVCLYYESKIIAVKDEIKNKNMAIHIQNCTLLAKCVIQKYQSYGRERFGTTITTHRDFYYGDCRIDSKSNPIIYDLEFETILDEQIRLAGLPQQLKSQLHIGWDSIERSER